MSGPVLRVMVTAGRDSGKVVEVTGERAVIGRDPECDIVLDDGNVSRRHAAIERLPDGSVCLSDLGSTNGTFVDGRRVDGPLALSGDEQVCLGDTVLAVERPPPPAPPPPPDPPPGPPAWATLTVRSGPLHGTTLRVAGERFVIGRHDGADLVLDDPKVSGRHADLSIEATGRVTLTDLGSRNGTWVDGRRVVDAVAVSGNEDVRIGDTLLAIAPVDGAPMPGDTVLSAVVPMWLVVESGADEGRRVEITSERFLVGRGPASDLVLDAHDVSRQHAILTASPERGAVVADLGSRNGTFVNDRRIDAPQALRTGDRVRIASVGLRFEEPGGTIAGAPPSAARMIPGAPSGIRGLSPGLSVDRTPPPLSTEGLARWCSRRPWTTFALWATALVAAAALVVALFADSLTSEGTVAGNPESKRGDALLQERLRGPRRITETVIVSSSSAGLTVGDAAFRERVTSIYDDAIGLGRDVVVRGRHFYQRRDRSLVSRDRRTTVMPLEMAGDLDHAAEQVPKLVDVVDRADRDPDFRVLVYGEASVDADFEKLSEEDLKTGEVYGLAIALVVLVFVFRALVAALIPMALAIVSIGVALGLTTLVAQAFSLSFFVTNMIVGMGLALGIDYTLFVLTRYREERGGGRAAPDAIAAAGGTAGRAVLFSGMAVVLALVGMLFVPDTVLRSLGVGAILVGIVSVVAALTILPAVLGVLGDRVNGGALPGLRTQAQEPAGTSFWARVATIVMRRPVVSLVLSVVVLAVAAVPVLDLRTGSSGVSTLPDRLTSKQGFVVLDREFDAGRGSPAEIVIDGRVESPPVRRAIDRLRARVDRDRDFGEPSAPRVNRRGDLALVTAPLSGDVQSPRAFAAIRRLRSTYIPDAFGATRAQVLVTGTTAFAVDEDAATSNAAPFVFAFVLGLSFVLLTLAFRSIVVPLKAIVMNLLSVGAAYGLLVLVFQEGHGASFFGFEQVAAVESWVPLFLFSVLFGLSMDYHVFLLSRIRERFNQTGDNREAVATGITTTARLITGAALIMVAVFSGFAAGDLVMFQQMGFGLAVALLIDATIVRSVLVPATMTLLGKRNWYLPRWLRWLPEVGVEGQGR